MPDGFPRVLTIGEVLIELGRERDGRFSLSCAGDTFNTAIYLARGGIDAGFATALGDDPFSEGFLSLMAAEGISSRAILRLPGRLPGIAVTDADPAAPTRRRYQWRSESPARDLFELREWPQVAEAMVGAKLIFFSGITLSLYSNVGLGRFFATLELARERGAKVAFDCNFRPRAWKGDLARARTVFMEALKRSDFALPAYDDEAVLWGDPSPEATVERLRAFGISEVAVKNGPNSVLVASASEQEHVPIPQAITPVDPAGAGDAFNAGYLAARLGGETPQAAAIAGHKLAGRVIQHPGALMPRIDAAVH
jgi:2-dehydro-3-deoxygluconokinase